MTITADRLLTGLKRRISSPSSQILMANSDYLEIADDVIRGYLVPLVTAARQDYFVALSTTPTVDGQDAYDVPYRSTANALRELKLVDSGGTTRNMALITLEDAHRFSSTTTTHSFYFRDDQIVLVPVPNTASTTIEFWWERRPSPLCQVDEAALVVSVAGDTVTCDTIPSTMVADVNIDFIRGKSGNRTLDMDVPIASVSGVQLVFASGAVPTTLTAGDYISIAETSPVVQLPDECYPYLESITAQRVLLALGDMDGANVLAPAVSEEAKNLRLLLEPRIQGEPTVIINRQGLLRGRRFMARRGLLY